MGQGDEGLHGHRRDWLWRRTGHEVQEVFNQCDGRSLFFSQEKTYFKEHWPRQITHYNNFDGTDNTIVEPGHGRLRLAQHRKVTLASSLWWSYNEHYQRHKSYTPIIFQKTATPSNQTAKSSGLPPDAAPWQKWVFLVFHNLTKFWEPGSTLGYECMVTRFTTIACSFYPKRMKTSGNNVCSVNMSTKKGSIWREFAK